MQQNHFQVRVLTSVQNRPKDHEMSAAILLMKHFRSDVVFLRPGVQKTPDLEIRGQTWEVKSPTGSSHKTIENNLRLARKQSKNIILDLRRCKLDDKNAIARLRFFLRSARGSIQRVKVITKTHRVIDIFP